MFCFIFLRLFDFNFVNSSSNKEVSLHLRTLYFNNNKVWRCRLLLIIIFFIQVKNFGTIHGLSCVQLYPLFRYLFYDVDGYSSNCVTSLYLINITGSYNKYYLRFPFDLYRIYNCTPYNKIKSPIFVGNTYSMTFYLNFLFTKNVKLFLSSLYSILNL